VARRDAVELRHSVEDQNPRVQQTYRALGMKPGGYHVDEDLWIIPRG